MVTISDSSIVDIMDTTADSISLEKGPMSTPVTVETEPLTVVISTMATEPVTVVTEPVTMVTELAIIATIG